MNNEKLYREYIKYLTQDSSYVCSGCNKKADEKMKVCSGCRSVRYCSKECQRKDWKDHKLVCDKDLLTESRKRVDFMYGFLSLPGKSDRIIDMIKDRKKKGILVIEADKLEIDDNQASVSYIYTTYDSPKYKEFKDITPPEFLNKFVPGKNYPTMIIDRGDKTRGIPPAQMFIIINR